MKKIKNFIINKIRFCNRSTNTSKLLICRSLIFCFAILISLSSLSLAITMTEINAIIEKYAAQYGVNPNLIRAMIKQESLFNTAAISSKGAIGLMQLMPSTAKSLGVNPYNNDDNIKGGTMLMSQFLKKYNGNVQFALAAYNAGPGKVDKAGGIPNISQTKNYVTKVTKYFEMYENGTLVMEGSVNVKNIKKCYSCQGTVGEEWYLIRDQHYRICKENQSHQFFDDTTKCTGENCELCKITVKVLDPDACLKCKEKLGEWQDDGNGNHVRKCKCGDKREEGIHFDMQGDLLCDVCNLTITQCYECGAKLKDEWYKDDEKHHKECEDGHHSYIGWHIYDEGVCILCDLEEKIKVNTVTENQKLIITMNHVNFKIDMVEAIAINSGETNLLWRNGLKTVEAKDNEKVINVLGNTLKIVDGEIILTINRGTLLANWLMDKENNLKISVDSNNITQTIETVIKGDFGSVPTITGFTDVEDNRWTMKEIDYVVKKGIMSGVGNNQFNPSGTVTRQELAVIINKIVMERKYTVENQAITYTDINQCADWAVDIVKLVGPYITNSTTFEPTKQVTRGEVVKALVKVFGLEERITITEETKSKVQEAMKAENIEVELEKPLGVFVQVGVLSKDEYGKFSLNKNMTRDHLAYIIYSVYTNEVVKIKCDKSNCTGTVIEKWQFDSQYHIRACTNGHDVDKLKHEYNEYGKCKVCHYNKGEDCAICTKGNRANWLVKETMHILICEQDKTHVMKIEGHIIDNNNICEVCGYVDTKEYPITFKDYTDQTHWAWDNVGHMIELGIVKGDEVNGQRYLLPNETITAEGFIVLLARTLGYNELKVQSVSNAIVANPAEKLGSEEEFKYLFNYLENNGKDANAEMMVLLSNNGVSATAEEIKDNYVKAISRERVAHLLGTFLQSNSRQETVADSFEDWGMVNEAYKERIKRLSAYDIFRGRVDNGKLYVSPTEPITRVEAIALMDRFNTVKSLGIVYGE